MPNGVDRVETFSEAKPADNAISPERAQQIAAALKQGSPVISAGVDVLKEDKGEAPAQKAPEQKPGEQKAERPAWLPEKFKTPEDFAKAYTELEKKQGSAKQPEQKPAEKKPAGLDALKVKQEEKPAGEAPKADADKTAEEVVQKAGLDMQALHAEWSERGELTAESLKKLDAVGIPKETVDLYIEGLQARAELIRRDLAATIGGDERLSEVIQWARQGGLSPAEGLAWDNTLATGNHDAIKMALTAIHAKFQAAGQDEPTGQLTGNRAGETADVYSDRSQLQADIRDPRYKTSEAFRQHVTAKLRRSNI